MCLLYKLLNNNVRRLIMLCKHHTACSICMYMYRHRDQVKCIQSDPHINKTVRIINSSWSVRYMNISYFMGLCCV